MFRVCEVVYMYVCVRLCIEHLGLACAFSFTSLLTCLNPMNYCLGSWLRAQRFTAYKGPAPLTMEIPVFPKAGTMHLLVAFKKHIPHITSIEPQTSTKAGDVWRFSGLWPAWLEDQQAGSGNGQVPRTIRISPFMQNGSSVSSLASRTNGFPRYPRDNIASEPYSSISMKEANESNRCI